MKRQYSFDPKRSCDDPMAEAIRLTALGYRRVSNRHATVARVDRADWREVMAAGHPRGMEWVQLLGRDAPDHYRRCHSNDWLEGVPAPIFRLIPGSGGDPTEYCP